MPGRMTRACISAWQRISEGCISACVGCSTTLLSRRNYDSLDRPFCRQEGPNEIHARGWREETVSGGKGGDAVQCAGPRKGIGDPVTAGPVSHTTEPHRDFGGARPLHGRDLPHPAVSRSQRFHRARWRQRYLFAVHEDVSSFARQPASAVSHGGGGADYGRACC